VHYLCKLLTYGHKICTVGASDMCASTEKLASVFKPLVDCTFQGHGGQKVKITFWVNKGHKS